MSRILKFFAFILLLSLIACGETSVTDKTVHAKDSVLVQGEGNLVGMDEDSPEQGGPNADPKYIEGEFTVEKAMAVVYGYYDKGMECSKWICKVSEQNNFADKIDETGHLYTKAAANFPFQTTEGEKVYLLTATAGRMGDGWESCHACAPILGIAQFGEIEGDWFVEALQKNLGTVGAWGELPDNQLVKIGPDNYGIMLSYGFTAQGFTEGGIRLIGIANDKFEVLLDRPTVYSNEGFYYEDHLPELAFAYDTEFSFVKGDNVNYYDLRLLATGKKPVKGKQDGSDITSFEEVVLMKFEDGKYVVADSSLKID